MRSMEHSLSLLVSSSVRAAFVYEVRLVMLPELNNNTISTQFSVSYILLKMSRVSGKVKPTDLCEEKV